MYAYATGTDGKDADEIAATTGIAGTTWLIELPAGGGGTEGAATAVVTAATAVTTTAVVVVLVLVLLALVALLVVALLCAPLHPINGAFSRCLFRAADGQRTPQRQRR